MELKDLRENTKEIKVEPRELKSDTKDLQHIARSEKHDGRVDVGSDTKHERGTYSEVKGHEKIDKDARIGSHSQWNWKHNNVDMKVEHKFKDESTKAMREKGDVKKETWTESDKEAPQNDIGTVDIPGEVVHGVNLTLQPKKRDCDPKDVKREAIDKKKEREGDVESERPDKRIRSSTIESDGGKTDLCCVVYKVRECVQEITKLWKEYESQADRASGSSQTGPTLEIRIPAEHVTANNRQVKSGQLWGTDIYTVDSDLVAVLMHTGYCHTTASTLPSPAQELRATLRVLPSQQSYISTLRNNVRSRAWGAAVSCSYRVERCCIVKNGGGIVDLEPCLTHSSTMEPTLAPVVVEQRTMTTRAAASNALRQKIFRREVTFQFNFCMEPWLKYSINAVADKGFKNSLFTSARLKKGEVLYVETHFCRYELCFNGEMPVKASIANTGNRESIAVDTFRWSRCKKPLPQETMLSIGIPLSLEGVEVLEENLEWDEIDWSQNGVLIAGKEYHLARAHFLGPN